MSLSIHGVVDPNRDDWNVIAESKGGDKNHVLVVDAHLDAIFGAGMLDNASGSATILEIAEKMKNVNPRNKLRFIWFGGEELGLLGSQFYVNNLSSNELSHIGYDLDADVTATPNYLDRGPRSGGTGPVRPHRHGDVPEPRVQGRRRSHAIRRSPTSTRSARTTSSCRRSEPTRSASTQSASRPAEC